MGSKRFVLDGTDWKKIGIGALVALGGVAVTYIADVVMPTIDGSTMAGAMITAVAGILLNAARKFIADYSKGNQ